MPYLCLHARPSGAGSTRMEGQVPATIASVSDDEIAEKALALIRANCVRTITLADIADVVRISPRHLQRLLARRGTSFQAERLSGRMHIAANRLLWGNTVANAARGCGYSSASHFCVAVTRAYGVPPSKLRIAGRLHERILWRDRQNRHNPPAPGSAEYHRRRRRQGEDADRLHKIACRMLPAGRQLIRHSLAIVEGTQP